LYTPNNRPDDGLSGYKASYNSYFKAVQVFVVDFAAASTVEMLKAEGYEAWSALTGRVIGYSPQAVVYAK